MVVSLRREPTRRDGGHLGEFGTLASTDDMGVTSSVAEPLRPWVASIQAFSMPKTSPRVFARLPESAASLVVCARHDGSVDIVAVGPRLRAFYKAAAVVPEYTRFTFRVGAARLLLGIPLHELSNRNVPLEELWGPRATTLRRRIEGARGGLRATIRAVESALIEELERAPTRPVQTKLFVAAAHALEENVDDPTRIPAIAERVGVSERQLRQVFRDDVGLSPKRFARIARIRRAAANAGRVGLAALAAENGFYDQAHLNAEFRDLLGATPREFAAGKVPVGGESCGE